MFYPLMLKYILIIGLLLVGESLYDLKPWKSFGIGASDVRPCPISYMLSPNIESLFLERSESYLVYLSIL